MALIKCPECGNDVSTSTDTCPHCGFPFKKSIKVESKPIENYPKPKNITWIQKLKIKLET